MEQRGLERLKRLAWILDDLVRIPGTKIRIGIDPLLGLLPGGGDVAGGVVSAYAIIAAARLGAPPSVILRMAANVAIDALLGVVPLIGDLFDFGWKANRRNVALLEEYTAAPATVLRRSRVLAVVVVAGMVVVLVGVAWVTIALLQWLVRVF